MNVLPPAPAQHDKTRVFNLSFSAQRFPELSEARIGLLCETLSAGSCLLPCLHILATSRAFVTLLRHSLS